MEITGQESFLEAVMLEPREVWGPARQGPCFILETEIGEAALLSPDAEFFLGSGVCATVWGLFFDLRWSAGCLSWVHVF